MTGTAAERPGKLPWPSEWNDISTAKYAFIALFFLVFGIGSLVIGFTTFLSGVGDSRAYLIGVASPFLLGLVADAVITRLTLRRRRTAAVRSQTVSELGAVGVGMPYSRPLGVIYVVAVVSIFLMFLVMSGAGLIVINQAEYSAFDVIQALVFGGLAAYTLVMLIEIGRKKLRRGQLTLTPAGVYHDGWSYSCFAPWDDVNYIYAADANGPVIVLVIADTDRQWRRRRTRLGRDPYEAYAPNIGIQARLLSVDPGLAYHALRFYRAYPAARAELGAEAGVQRIRSGNVVTA